MNIKKAFTLNELLIAMTIIGIILIVTVPFVVSHFNKKSQVVALQRSYTSVVNAVKLLMIDERVKSITKSSLYLDEDGDVTSTAGAFIKKYFNVKKDCETETGECFASSYVNLNKQPITLPSKDEAYCALLSTDASICIIPTSKNQGKPGQVVVDVNGPQKPNIAGRDLFVFYIYMDGFIGDRVSSTGDPATDTANCKANTYGSGCFNRIINSDWSMDY